MTTKHDKDPSRMRLITAIQLISSVRGKPTSTIRRRIESGSIKLTQIPVNQRVILVPKSEVMAELQEAMDPKSKPITDKERRLREAWMQEALNAQQALVRDLAEWMLCAKLLVNAQTPFQRVNARAMYDRLCGKPSPHTAPALSAAEQTRQALEALGLQLTAAARSSGKPQPARAG